MDYDDMSTWWFQPIWKNMLVKLDHLPRVENKKSLKTPPRYLTGDCLC